MAFSMLSIVLLACVIGLNASPSPRVKRHWQNLMDGVHDFECGTALENANRECWKGAGNCRKGGPCSFCGEGGTCCRRGWTKGDGCTGKNGCNGYHCCVSTNEFTNTHFAGMVVDRIKSYHSNWQEDRRWEWSCRKSPAGPAPDAHCRWSDYINRMDGQVRFECNTDEVLVGTYSYHSDGKEDRRFKYKCCQMAPTCERTECENTDYINGLDDEMNEKIPEDKVLVGVFSEHWNFQEDRRWQLRLCKFECGPEATYTLLGLEWDTSSLSNSMGKPTVVAHGSYVNRGNAEITDTITLSKEISESSTTTWEHHLGTGVEMSWGSNFVFGDVSATVSLTYDYTQGKESSKTETRLFERSIDITIPAHSHIEAKLVLKESDKMKIPFTAKFRKTTRSGKTSEVEEKGTWEGVMYYDMTIQTDDVKDPE